ncbi:hypothetical protein [Salinicola sp. CR57]|uniref:hypothetical protein n=1 Tax=Salinicola sp. CR57 TaxID=1949086 RepID=UPI000DA24493|nr:hypothetical protein [Salinicola sp. CR57]
MSTPPIPTTFEEWHHCITVECQISLTREYVAQRLQALDDPRDYATQRLIAFYGRRHHQQVVSWFEQAARSFASPST